MVATARTDTGRNAAQIAARPEPTARAGPPTRIERSTDQSTARAVSGAVAGVAASATVSRVTTTYPTAKQAMATGTVQSRSPSEMASESGPCPEIESPIRCPIRHVAQAATRVISRGATVTAAPSTRTPDP